MLGRLANRLLTPAEAIAQRVAGLWLSGLPAPLSPAMVMREPLTRAAARELADAETARRESIELLGWLAAAGLTPTVLKGRALQRWWPAPRPAGDLDLLLPEPAVARAATALEAHGFRRVPGETRGRFRPPPTGVELAPPAGRAVGVDLHERLFRSVGGQLAAATVLARSTPAMLDGVAVRALDPVDRLVFVYVHAAKHGVRALKWLFDACALALDAAPETLAAAVTLAERNGLGRPFWATARLVAALLPERLPAPSLAAIAPSPLLAALIARCIDLQDVIAARPLGALDRYALELLLESSLRARLRMALGVAERLFRARANEGTPHTKTHL
jgi:putative nucleotidyltransferase-like protein